MLAVGHCGPSAPTHGEQQSFGQLVGYFAIIFVTCTTLNLLPFLRLPATEVASAQTFVLAALDVIPGTAGQQIAALVEVNLLTVIEAFSGRSYDPGFCDAVLRKWRSPAVSDVLQSRGLMQTGTTMYEEHIAKLRARQRADIEEIGLQHCALPSCDKTERTVHEFKLCSGCRAVKYCCAEHHALDWGVHRNACAKLDAARKKASTQGGAAE